MPAMMPFGLSASRMLDNEDYFERTKEFTELDSWLSRVNGGLGGPALLVGQRGVGKSQVIQEWLRRALEEESRDIIPFYYAFQSYAMEGAIFARSYFSAFLLQYARRRAPRMKLRAPHDTSWDNLRELCEEAHSPSLYELVGAVEEAHKNGDAQNLIGLAISAPHWIAKLERVFCPVVLDNAELMQKAYCGDRAHPLWPHFQPLYHSSLAPHMFCGSRPSLRAALPALFSEFSNLRTIEVRPLDVADSMAMIKTLCNREGLEFDIDVAEQMAGQLRGVPFYIQSLIERVKIQGRNVVALQQAQKLFAEEISEGAIHWFWRSVLQTHFPSVALRQGVLKLCHHLLTHNPRAYNFASLCRRFSFKLEDFDNTVQLLQVCGILSETFGAIRLIDDTVLHDVILAMHWRDIEGLEPPAVVQRLTQQRLVASTRLMQRKPSQQLVGSLQRMLEGFNAQHVPLEWFHYGRAVTDTPIPATKFDPAAETMLRLPTIVGTIANNILEPSATPPPFEDFMPPSLLSFGFYDGKFLPDHENIWLTSIFANYDTVSTDELKIVLSQKEEAEQRFQIPVQYIWVIAGKDLTNDALEFAGKHRIYTSNLDMVQRISSWLIHSADQTLPDAEKSARITPVPKKPARISATEYEIEIPVAPDMELLAAQSLEQVARMAQCDSQTIAKLKMALLEASLNVVNYDTGAGRRVKVKFEILADRLNLTVCNATPIDPADPAAKEGGANASGMKLINKLVDRMSVETLPDGTRIHLTCMLPARQGLSAAGRGVS